MEKRQVWVGLGTRRDKKQMVPKETYAIKEDFFFNSKESDICAWLRTDRTQTIERVAVKVQENKVMCGSASSAEKLESGAQLQDREERLAPIWESLLDPSLEQLFMQGGAKVRVQLFF